MGESLLLALGLALLIEGLGADPAAAHVHWYPAVPLAVQRVAGMRDGQIRFMGMGAILVGLLLISL